jgi:hypothetical protein
MVLKNPRTRDALIGAAAQVNAKVRQSAEAFVQSEISPLHQRIEELEARVARLEQLVATLSGAPRSSRRGDFDPNSV